MSEIFQKRETGMSDPVDSSSRQWSRRELAKMAVAGTLGATQLGRSLSGFAQEKTSSTGASPRSQETAPRIKLACYFPADGTDDDLVFLKQIGVDHLHVTGKSQQVFSVEELQTIKKRAADAGFSAEMMPTALDHVMDNIILNRPGRDRLIAADRKSVV